jgi:ATP-dependent RNA circularization protein (DNA/RNA ligase family)
MKAGSVAKDTSKEQLMVKTWLHKANIADLNPGDFKRLSCVPNGFVFSRFFSLYIHSIKE